MRPSYEDGLKIRHSWARKHEAKLAREHLNDRRKQREWEKVRRPAGHFALHVPEGMRLTGQGMYMNGADE